MRKYPRLCGQPMRRGYVDSNRATGHPQSRPAFLFRNGVGMRDFLGPRIFGRASIAVRRFPRSPHCITCTEPCSRHGSSCWLRKPPWVVAGRTDIHRTLGVAGAVLAASCSSSALPYLSRPCGAMVGRQAAIRAISLPRSAISLFGVLVGAAVLQRQQSDTNKRSDAARNNLASNRRRRPIFRARRCGRGTKPAYGTDAFVGGACHLRSRLARAPASGDPLGWCDGGGLQAAAVLSGPRHVTMAGSRRRSAHLDYRHQARTNREAARGLVSRASPGHPTILGRATSRPSD
jgi:hypothetical protein